MFLFILVEPVGFEPAGKLVKVLPFWGSGWAGLPLIYYASNVLARTFEPDARHVPPLFRFILLSAELSV